MNYGSRDSLKEELKWKKAIQRRLLDSGHDGSSVRLFGIVACLAVLVVVSVLIAFNYSMNGNAILNAMYSPSDASTIIAAVPNSKFNQAVDSNAQDIAEVVISASEAATFPEARELQLALPNSDALSQNSDNDIQVMFQKESTSAPIVLFSKSFCPFCTEIKKILLPYNQNAEGEKVVNVIELDKQPDGRLLLDGIEQLVGRRSVPQTFINGEYFGGLRNVKEAEESGELAKLILIARSAFKDSQIVVVE